MKSGQLRVDPELAADGRSRAGTWAPVYLISILMIAGLGMATIAFAYWPGIMIDDARWQYQQSVDNAYEDWHPPLMAWIWHHLIPLAPGPGPMLLLQLSLCWTGIALVAVWLYRRASPRFAIAAACTGLLPAPFALMGSITKDCLMAGALSCAVGLLLWSATVRNRTGRAALIAAGIIALLLAAALRVNAFVACVPLALALLPKPLTRTIPRFALSAVASAGIFFMVPAAVSAALHAEDTDSQLSLIIFDLGGITERTGVNQFPDLGVANPVAVNHRCYDPIGWDSYSTWAKRPCPLGFERFQSLVDEGDTDPRLVWLHAMVSHPIAYAEHRLDYFNRSSWFLVPNDPEPTAWTQSVPNPWNFRVRPNPVLKGVDTAANAAARTPFGWPIFWIALALAILITSRLAKLNQAVAAVAGSAFLYGTAYLIFGVATGMRYYVWTITGTALAAVLAASELSRRPGRLDRRAIVMAATVILVPTSLAAFARLNI